MAIIKDCTNGAEVTKWQKSESRFCCSGNFKQVLSLCLKTTCF